MVTNDVKLSAAMAHLCATYPRPTELSNARLTKLVYLADWEAARVLGRQITKTEWVFNHYGPWVSDVMDVARTDPAFDILETTNAYGSAKKQIALANLANTYADVLSESEKELLDRVVARTKGMYFGEFIDFVYGTHPVETQRRYATLDLVALADEANAEAPPEPLKRPDRDAIGVPAEQSAQIRELVHDAIATLLGTDISLEEQAALPVRLHDASIEQTTSSLELSLSNGPDAGIDVSTEVIVVIEGFLERSELESAKELLLSMEVRDEQWNSHYVWVAYPVRSWVTFTTKGFGDEATVNVATCNLVAPA